MNDERSLDDVFASICAMELPLRERLSAFTAAMPAHEWGQPFAVLYERLISQLDSANSGDAAPTVGDMLPPFVLPDADGNLVDSAALIDNGPTIVSFNRGHWCQYCELELLAFAHAHQEFAAHGARVVSIMPERQSYLKRARERTGDTVIFLSDLDNAYALELGLVVWLGQAIKDLYTSHGIDLGSYQGNDMWFAPIPATFVVAKGGKILARHVDPDFRTRMDIEDILACLERIGSGRVAD